jgi:hypothetical protein
MGRRVRRLLPGVVVGSGALVGTGALMAWVGDRPGLHSAATASAAPTPPPTNSSNGQVLSELDRQLQIDASEVQQLGVALSKLEAARRAAAANASRVTTVVGGSSAVGSPSNGTVANPQGAAAPSALPSIGSIGSIGSVNIPTIPSITPIAVPAPSTSSSPPATNATTGASHVAP